MSHRFDFLESIQEFGTHLSDLQGREIFVLVDENTHKHCWPKLIEATPALEGAELIEIPAGEESKSLDIAYQLWAALATQKATRNSIVINLGGGVVTDLGGFIASTFKRGLEFIHIPTSLLGMVDAAIGGKTGIDLDHAKNLIGTFSPATKVLICPDFLSTLPASEMISGFAEMLKHGLISSEELWKKCIDINPLQHLEVAALLEESCMVKSEIVQNDPHESGERKLLNLGHTFGHGIESFHYQQKTPISHGRAVAAGIVCEAYLSNELGLLPDEKLNSLLEGIQRFYSFNNPKPEYFEKIWEFMLNDKKNESNEVRFVLLEKIGKSKIDVSATYEECERTWGKFCELYGWKE